MLGAGCHLRWPVKAVQDCSVVNTKQNRFFLSTQNVLEVTYGYISFVKFQAKVFVSFVNTRDAKWSPTTRMYCKVRFTPKRNELDVGTAPCRSWIGCSRTGVSGCVS